MQQAFLIIISIAGAAYAFITRQSKIGLGFLTLTVSFVLALPITSGFWSDLLNALSLIIFLCGVIVIVWKKKEIEEEPKVEPETGETIKNGQE